MAISGLGGLGVDTNSAWYRDLKLPSWQPPGAAFGPVWTVLYALLQQLRVYSRASWSQQSSDF